MAALAKEANEDHARMTEEAEKWRGRFFLLLGFTTLPIGLWIMQMVKR